MIRLIVTMNDGKVHSRDFDTWDSALASVKTMESKVGVSRALLTDLSDGSLVPPSPGPAANAT